MKIGQEVFNKQPQQPHLLFQNEFFLCPQSQELSSEPKRTSAQMLEKLKEKEAKMMCDTKEDLSDYLPHISGDLNATGLENWSLQRLMTDNIVLNKELRQFSGSAFVGFNLKEGEAIPDSYKMEPSTLRPSEEKIRKKPKTKKHRISHHEGVVLGHLLENMPHEGATHSASVTSMPMETSDEKYNANTQYSLDPIKKKPKKAEKKRKKEKEGKKSRDKDKEKRREKERMELHNKF